MPVSTEYSGGTSIYPMMIGHVDYFQIFAIVSIRYDLPHFVEHLCAFAFLWNP